MFFPARPLRRPCMAACRMLPNPTTNCSCPCTAHGGINSVRSDAVFLPSSAAANHKPETKPGSKWAFARIARLNRIPRIMLTSVDVEPRNALFLNKNINGPAAPPTCSAGPSPAAATNCGSAASHSSAPVRLITSARSREALLRVAHAPCPPTARRGGRPGRGRGG